MTTIHIKYNNNIKKINLYDVTTSKLSIVFDTQVNCLIDEQGQVHFPNSSGMWSNLHGGTIYSIKGIILLCNICNNTNQQKVVLPVQFPKKAFFSKHNNQKRLQELFLQTMQLQIKIEHWLVLLKLLQHIKDPPVNPENKYHNQVLKNLAQQPAHP